MNTTDEAKHLINMGLEFLLIVIFINAAMIFVSLRDDYAQAYNDKITLQQSVGKELKYIGYKTGNNILDREECFTGNQVIETIRAYTTGELRVYVDHDINGNPINMNQAALNATPYLFSVAYLTDVISASDFYHPFLIYDSDEMTDLTSSGDEITGITFIKYTGS